MEADMRAQYLQHVSFEGPAKIAEYARDLGYTLAGTRVFEGAALPDTASFDALFVLGGPMSVHGENAHPWLIREKRFIEECIAAGKKVAGICLGAQMIAQVLGGRVCANPHREIGWFPVTRTAEADSCGAGRLLPPVFAAFHWHGETFSVPSGAVRLAQSEACENQAFAYGGHVLALQFHLEAGPESIRLLMEHSADDLKPGPFVRDPSSMLDETLIRESNDLLKPLLAGWLLKPP
jgi:GMP synthase-like glutamine amidotransferase